MEAEAALLELGGSKAPPAARAFVALQVSVLAYTVSVEDPELREVLAAGRAPVQRSRRGSDVDLRHSHPRDGHGSRGSLHGKGARVYAMLLRARAQRLLRVTSAPGSTLGRCPVQQRRATCSGQRAIANYGG